MTRATSIRRCFLAKLFTTRLVLTSSVILIFSLLFGCGAKITRSSGRTSGNAGMSITDPGGTTWSRQIKYSVDSGSVGMASGVPRQDFATVNFTAGKIVIERDRVLLNDNELAKIAANTKLVDIDYTRGTLTITADGNKA